MRVVPNNWTLRSTLAPHTSFLDESPAMFIIIIIINLNAKHRSARKCFEQIPTLLALGGRASFPAITALKLDDDAVAYTCIAPALRAIS